MKKNFVLSNVLKFFKSLISRPNGQINWLLVGIIAVVALIFLPTIIKTALNIAILAIAVVAGLYLYNTYLKK